MLVSYKLKIMCPTVTFKSMYMKDIQQRGNNQVCGLKTMSCKLGPDINAKAWVPTFQNCNTSGKFSQPMKQEPSCRRQFQIKNKGVSSIT